MKRELDSIANFITHRVRVHQRQKKEPIPEHQLREFNRILARLFCHPASFRGWFIISQLKTNASVTCAAELCHIKPETIYESFARMITIVVDHGEVNYQVGIDTSFDTLYLKGHYHLGAVWAPQCCHLECYGDCQLLEITTKCSKQLSYHHGSAKQQQVKLDA